MTDNEIAKALRYILKQEDFEHSVNLMKILLNTKREEIVKIVENYEIPDNIEVANGKFAKIVQNQIVKDILKKLKELE